MTRYEATAAPCYGVYGMYIQCIKIAVEPQVT